MFQWTFELKCRVRSFKKSITEESLEENHHRWQNYIVDDLVLANRHTKIGSYPFRSVGNTNGNARLLEWRGFEIIASAQLLRNSSLRVDTSLCAPIDIPSSLARCRPSRRNAVTYNNHSHLRPIQKHVFVLGNTLRHLRLTHMGEEGLECGLVVKYQFGKRVVVEISLRSYQDCGRVIGIFWVVIGERGWRWDVGPLNITSRVWVREVRTGKRLD